jgi:hypothetical protein
MTKKTTLPQKRTTTSLGNPAHHELSEHHRQMSSSSNPSRIIGLSKDGLIVLALVASLYGNYRLFNGFKGLDEKVSTLESRLHDQKEREIKITLDQKLDKVGNNSDELRAHFDSLRKDIDKRFSQLESSNKLSVQSSKPASSPIRMPASSTMSDHAQRMKSIDVSKYSVSNYGAYPKYHYFLSEQSRRYRTINAMLSDIITDYAKGHRITGADRPEYYRLLETRDSVLNQLRDIQDNASENWKKTHRRYARN